MDNLKKHWIEISLALLLAGSFFLMVFSARTDSITVDEKVHIEAGYLHVYYGNYAFNTEHPPLFNDLAGLFAKLAHPNLPSRPITSFQPYTGGQWDYAADFFYHSGNDVEAITFFSRLPFIFLTLGLIYLVFLWGRTLFGPKAGLCAAALAAFDPNMLAHGRLATTDMGLVFFFVLTLWLFRKFFLESSWNNTVLFSLALGGLILAKFSGVFIFPIILIVLILFLRRKEAKDKLFKLIVGLLISAILVWIVYAFSMRSDIIGGILEWIKAPFEKYYAGYQMVASHNAIGHWSYFNGVVDYSGWWQYFLEVLALKVTIPVMAALLVALFYFRKIHKSFFEEFLIIFTFLFFLGISLTSKIDIGIRHILVLLPFLYIFISRLAASGQRVIKIFIVVVVTLQIAISLLAYPNYISYFNQFAGGPVKASSYIADSNLDWDQNMIRFAKYTKENNIDKVYELCWNYDAFGYYGISAEILPNNPPDGVVVICIQQIRVPPEGFSFSWATSRTPTAIIGDTMYVWDFRK